MEGREKAFPHPLSHSGGIWILQLSLIGEGMRKTVPQLTGKENEKQGAKVNALTGVLLSYATNFCSWKDNECLGARIVKR